MNGAAMKTHVQTSTLMDKAFPLTKSCEQGMYIRSMGKWRAGPLGFVFSFPVLLILASWMLWLQTTGPKPWIL